MPPQCGYLILFSLWFHCLKFWSCLFCLEKVQLVHQLPLLCWRNFYLPSNQKMNSKWSSLFQDTRNVALECISCIWLMRYSVRSSIHDEPFHWVELLRAYECVPWYLKRIVAALMQYFSFVTVVNFSCCYENSRLFWLIWYRRQHVFVLKKNSTVFVHFASSKSYGFINILNAHIYCLWAILPLHFIRQFSYCSTLLSWQATRDASWVTGMCPQCSGPVPTLLILIELYLVVQIQLRAFLLLQFVM